VTEAVKTNILDTLSCALAGSSAKGIAEVADLVRGWGGRAEPQAQKRSYSSSLTSSSKVVLPNDTAV
jgi:hypothetical protein